jgi:hypothetical protein
MEEGIVKAETNANPVWLSEAETIILKLAQTGKFFTSDNVIEQLNDKGITTHNNSALGGVFLRLKNSGVIEPCGYRLSKRRSRHKAPVRIWRGVNDDY